MHDIAIHHRPNSFSDRWISGCAMLNVRPRIVDAYHTDVFERLNGAHAFLWHFGHGIATDLLIARHILYAASRQMPVFPNFETCWHFDDKVAQKYLLESIDAPLIRTWVFYDFPSAMEWINTASFPKVFKLRRGSGSRNVRLVGSRDEAESLARRAFSKGFAPIGSVTSDLWKIQKFRKKRELMQFLRTIPQRLSDRAKLNKFAGKEIGYLYFQEFIPDNKHDTRVTIIGDRAFGFLREVRTGDFRASGSGQLIYDRSRIAPELIEIAFRVAERLGAQSVAFDFLKSTTGKPLIGEISYGFDSKPVFDCQGFWNRSGEWHQGAIWPEHAILEDIVRQIS